MWKLKPQIELIEPETDLDPILADVETLPAIVEHQDILNIEQEQEMGSAKEYGTLEAVEQRIDPDVPSLAEGELPVTTFPARIDTPEETPNVCRSSRAKFQTNPDYIPSMSGKKYETVNTQVECEENLHPDSNMFIYQ